MDTPLLWNWVVNHSTPNIQRPTPPGKSRSSGRKNRHDGRMRRLVSLSQDTIAWKTQRTQRQKKQKVTAQVFRIQESGVRRKTDGKRFALATDTLDPR
jgi:hypothetical protein